jgi:hypothetical protein
MMSKIISALGVATALMAIAPAATPALAQSRWDWGGGQSDGREYRLTGPGVQILYPELRNSRRGRAFVIRNFDMNQDGFINPREARAANLAFAQAAGPRRDRFDWEARDRTAPDRPDRPDRAANWDHRAMRDYHFRQTRQGATLTLQEDVLFRTDSDVLRWRAREAAAAGELFAVQSGRTRRDLRAHRFSWHGCP